MERVVALLVALVLALEARADDGGIPDGGLDEDPIYARCPAAPPVMPVFRCMGDELCEDYTPPVGEPYLAPFSWPYEEDGGYVLSRARGSRIVCLQAACDDHRETLKEELDAKGPSWWWVAAIGAFVVGLTLGFGLKPGPRE